MALTKETVVDKIEVLEMGQVQVRTATRVKEDGAVLSSSFHRHVVVPSVKTGGSWADTDISGEDARVQAVATATWTSEVKTAYQEMVDAQAL
jgi:K+-transporting ATPase c subunit